MRSAPLTRWRSAANFIMHTCRKTPAELTDVRPLLDACKFALWLGVNSVVALTLHALSHSAACLPIQISQFFVSHERSTGQGLTDSRTDQHECVATISHAPPAPTAQHVNDCFAVRIWPLDTDVRHHLSVPLLLRRADADIVAPPPPIRFLGCCRHMRVGDLRRQQHASESPWYEGHCKRSNRDIQGEQAGDERGTKGSVKRARPAAGNGSAAATVAAQR
ncbi:hypothetical protein JKP88DRAFT_301393 [Tribonema minus]|uniref:Uncharacterized protein n=1 Tax=Tribonema minus TaxID=303371 RepID=A0A835ZBX4_9STRA|nr:hypothetical protein JKP88DRAFT_301393 [Tribonema minus]